MAEGRRTLRDVLRRSARRRELLAERRRLERELAQLRREKAALLKSERHG